MGDRAGMQLIRLASVMKDVRWSLPCILDLLELVDLVLRALAEVEGVEGSASCTPPHHHNHQTQPNGLKV